MSSSTTVPSEAPLCGLDDDPSTIRFDPWVDDLHFRGGGSAFGHLVERVQGLMDAVASSRPDARGAEEAARIVDEALKALAPATTGPGQGFSGNRYDLPGRGHPQLVPVVYSRWVTNEIVGRVTFGPRHIGGNGAVHGGVISLMFDEVLGRLANANRPDRCRTAYLKTDYRQVTLPGVDYVIDATVDSEVGRKRHLSGRLTGPDGVVTADVTGLFVVLRDGAP